MLHRFGALAAAVLLGLLAIASLAQLDIAAGNFAAMAPHLVLLGSLLGDSRAGDWRHDRSRTPALRSAAAVAVLRFFANTLAPHQHASAWLQRLSPFAC